MSEPAAPLAEPSAPEPAPPPAPPAPTPLKERIQAFRAQHEKAETAAFFALGFIIDVVTLGRIDDVLTLVQHAVYMLILGTLLMLDQRYVLKVATPPPWLQKVLPFSESAIHFFFGSLLSSFALFYFKSASGLTSVLFLVLMFGLLVANELPRFRALGPVVRFGLFAFIITSYLAYAGPILVGFLSAWLFLLAVALSLGVSWLLFKVMARWLGDVKRAALRVFVPGAAVQVLLVLLYTFRMVPPVPLSVQYLGIYHDVTREGSAFKLTHYRPGWRFWHHGDQLFQAREGDRIYCFARIFAPRNFRDRVNIRWLYLDEKRGWLTSDVIPLTVTGGRNEGFRGFAYKSNHKPGDWRVQVETEDGREIGYISLEVEPDASTEERVPRVELR
ncbi:MAG: DUF2914 domain-containing protein [Myxococcota bacterium]